jgi:hypothetical protein
LSGLQLAQVSCQLSSPTTHNTDTRERTNTIRHSMVAMGMNNIARNPGSPKFLIDRIE